VTSVLFITKYPPQRDGVGDYTYELSKYLRKYCKVGILTFKERNAEYEESVYRLLEQNRKLSFLDVQRYAKLLMEKHGYEVIHFQTASFTFPRNFYLFPLFLDAKLVSTVHEVLTLRQFHYLPFVYNVYSRSRIIITLSKEIAKMMMKLYRIKPHRIKVMHHGADINLFRPDVDPSRFKEAFGLKDDFIIMTLGFIGKGKGHDTLIQSFIKVAKEMPNAKLVIAGFAKDKSYLYYLKSLASKIKDRVIFTDYVPYEILPACLASADIFVLPYKGGLHPSGPLHRALASGRAIIASNTPVFREVIKHRYNGMLIDVNVDNLSNAILDLYKNEDLRRELAKNARKFAEENLDWDIIAKQTLKIYEELDKFK